MGERYHHGVIPLAHTPLMRAHAPGAREPLAPEPVRHSTLDARTHRVVEWVGDGGARELQGTGISTPAPHAFWLRRESRTFDAVSVERVTGRALESSRPASDNEDDLECAFVVSGQLVVHGDQSLLFSDQQVALLPRWVEHRVEARTEATVLRIRVGRDAVAQIAPSLPVGPVVLPMRPGLLTGTRAFAEAMLSSGTPVSAVEGYAVGQLLVEMVAGLLLDHFGLGAGDIGTSATLRDQAIAVIAQRRSDPRLSVDEIASSIFVSPRRLQAAFAEAGTTVSAEIRRQRTALAVELLTSPRYAVLGMDDIATQAGFGSPLSMRRAVSELHGGTPSQIRRSGR